MSFSRRGWPSSDPHSDPDCMDETSDQANLRAASRRPITPFDVLHSGAESKFTQERGRDVGVGDWGRTTGIDHGIDKLNRVCQLPRVGEERSRPGLPVTRFAISALSSSLLIAFKMACTHPTRLLLSADWLEPRLGVADGRRQIGVADAPISPVACKLCFLGG